MKILKLLMNETFAPTSSNSQIEKHCRAIDFAYATVCYTDDQSLYFRDTVIEWGVDDICTILILFHTPNDFSKCKVGGRCSLSSQSVAIRFKNQMTTDFDDKAFRR